MENNNTTPCSDALTVLAWDIGTRTLSYCGVCLCRCPGAHDMRVQHWGIIDIVEENADRMGIKNKAKITLEQCNDALLYSVRQRDELMPVNYRYIVIEQQPAGGQNRFSSVRMKVLSHVLYSFYWIENKNITTQTQQATIGFVSPSIKLRGLHAQRKAQKALEGTCDDGKTASQKQRVRYKENKAYAVAQTRTIVGVEDLKQMETYKKQDDLCDAFLLAYEYAVSK